MRSVCATLVLSLSLIARMIAAPPATCATGQGYYDYTSSTVTLYVCTTTNTWTSVSANALLPTGSIIGTLGASCPTGFTEVSTLNGKMVRGTVAANGDVGQAGGNATITPTGSVSAPTFTGNAVASTAVSAGTPAGTNSTATVATTSGSFKGTSAGGFSAVGGAAPGSSFTVPAQTFTGSALGTHQHTTTATGTVSAPTFTGAAVDPSPPYVKVIFCAKS